MDYDLLKLNPGYWLKLAEKADGRNPYLDLFKENFVDHNSFPLIIQRELTEEEQLDYWRKTFYAAAARWPLCRYFSFAIPTDQAIQTMVPFSPIIDIGAGTGYWAKLIEDAGGEVVAVDKHQPKKQHHLIVVDNHEIIQAYPEHTLFLSWPATNEMIEYLAEHYEGKRILLIHEECCADVSPIREKFVTVNQIGLPQWFGCQDYLEILERK